MGAGAAAGAALGNAGARMTTTCSAGRGSGRFGAKIIDETVKMPKRKTPISKRASEHKNESSQSLDWLGIIKDGANVVMCDCSMKKLASFSRV